MRDTALRSSRFKNRVIHYQEARFVTMSCPREKQSGRHLEQCAVKIRVREAFWMRWVWTEVLKRNCKNSALGSN